MSQWAIITGAGTGIGAALAIHLSRRVEGVRFLLLGRRVALLNETKALCKDPSQVETASVDLASLDAAGKIAALIPENDRVLYLVHNAALLNPAKSTQVSHEDWTQAFQVNVHSPLFVTQSLLGRMKESRVLHISSGAAHRAIPGWSAYCSTKAAFHMLFKSLQTEVPKDIAVFGSVRPGVVDTPMQEQIRGLTEDTFPMVDFFRSKKENDELESVEKVAHFLSFLLLDTTAEEFGKDEWDIRDEHHQKRWNSKEN